MLLWKPEVRCRRFTSRLGNILEDAAAWSLQNGVDVRITSINDPAPTRVNNTLHAFDLAVDLNPVTEKAADQLSLANYLRVWLEPGYDVVLETDHVHVEYDVHRPALGRG